MPATATALVTGGAGFIGSHVATRLLSQGVNVVIADDLSGSSMANVPPGAVLAIGDLKNASFVDQLFLGTSFDYVYHLAAYAAEGLSHFVRSFNYRTNLISTALLINAAVKAKHPIKCFVFTSSIAVYGRGQLPMDESAAPTPEDPYGIAKLAAELDLIAAHRVFGLPYVIFRPHNVFGPRQARDRYRNVISIFLSRLRARQPLPIFGDGLQTRAFTYIDDVAYPIADAPFILSCHNQTFNVGSDETLTVRDLAAEMARAWGVPLAVEHLPARHEVQHAHAAHSRLRAVFGTRAPQTPLAEGIRATVAWARAQPWQNRTIVEWADPSVAAVEVRRNLPPSWETIGLQQVPEVLELRPKSSSMQGPPGEPMKRQSAGGGAADPPRRVLHESVAQAIRWCKGKLRRNRARRDR